MAVLVENVGEFAVHDGSVLVQFRSFRLVRLSLQSSC